MMFEKTMKTTEAVPVSGILKAFCVSLLLVFAIPLLLQAEGSAPLKLVQSIPMPGLKDGDFDHFAIDLDGHRLFLTAEENGLVEVFDTGTNKLVHTIRGMKAPHSMVYRGDLHRLFVVDGDASEIKVYDTKTYALVGHIALYIDADSQTYDPESKLMYVVSGGRAAHTPYSYITIVDTTQAKKVLDMKIGSQWLEALTLDADGKRIFVNLTSDNAVGVIDRDQHSVTAKWPIPADTQQMSPLYLDRTNHRLLLTTRKSPKLVVVDSETGKVKASIPCVGMVDDLAFDAKLKRVYLSGDGFVEVFKQDDADKYTSLGKVAGGFRAKTAIFVPDLNRYYLAVPAHAGRPAEVKVFEPVP
jgi:DNA-binding beta-propeller fold protein YncE